MSSTAPGDNNDREQNSAGKNQGGNVRATISEGSKDAGDEDHERLAFLNREAAEVYLLLDFLSGRADRSLRPTQDEQARALLDQRNNPDPPKTKDEQDRAKIEEDLGDPTRLVLRTMRIQYPVERVNNGFEADATFLVRARDVLNTRAAPATGATIAFTSLVFIGSSAATRSDFAKRAYPQFEASAGALARSIAWTLRGMLVVLIAALCVSGYTAWGKVMLDTLDAVRRDDHATQQELEAARSGANPPLSIQAFCGPERADWPPVCARNQDVKVRFVVTSDQLAKWEAPPWRWQAIQDDQPAADKQKRIEEWATAFIAVLGNYVMPILYGLLGSIAYVLRRHYDRLAAQLLSPRDLRANSIRLALGVLIGGCIGLVYSGTSAAQASGILGAAATLSTAAIAFLAGYGVEGVFKTLDALITQVFRVNGTDKAAPQS